MKAKRKSTVRSNETIRAPYKWHLQSEFETDFDSSHWWKEQPDSSINPVSALYELARRHPVIGCLRRKFHNAPWYGQELRPRLTGNAKERMASAAFNDLHRESNAVHCLCLIGLKSWPQLDWRNQEYWEMSAGNIKGIDCRDDLERCQSINRLAQTDLYLKRAFSLQPDAGAFQFKVDARNPTEKAPGILPVNPQAHENTIELLKKSLEANQISVEEMENAIAHEAVSAFRQGHLLISIAKDMRTDKARILLENEYRKCQKLQNTPKQRASFYLNWLSLIADFEDDEERHGMAKAQVFVQYRRAIDGVQFPIEEICERANE